jgi:hypothetical protein
LQDNGLGIQSLWRQINCTAIVPTEDRSTLSFSIAEAKAQASLLVNWHVATVKRECNLVVHELAHLARRTTHTAVRLGRASACVHDLIKTIVIL